MLGAPRSEPVGEAEEVRLVDRVQHLHQRPRAWGLGPPAAGVHLAMAVPAVLPSAFSTASAPRTFNITRLNTQPAVSPVNASTPPSRATPHDSAVWRLPFQRTTLSFATIDRPPGAQRRFDPRSLWSAKPLIRPVLRQAAWRKILVVFEGCSHRAVDCSSSEPAEIRSLSPVFSEPVDFGFLVNRFGPLISQPNSEPPRSRVRDGLWGARASVIQLPAFQPAPRHLQFPGRCAIGPLDRRVSRRIRTSGCLRASGHRDRR